MATGSQDRESRVGMWRGSSAGGSQGAAMEGTGGELGGQGNWGLEDAPGLLARASLPIMPAWPLPLASSALTLLLGALTSLFLWYCYRLGSQDMQALGAGRPESESSFHHLSMGGQRAKLSSLSLFVSKMGSASSPLSHCIIVSRKMATRGHV